MGSRRCRVGVFGAYYGKNFGDDLMAVMFGRRIQELGFPVTVFGLGKEYEAQYGFPVVSSAAELVAASDVIVVGGGGLLQPRSNESSFFSLELGVLLESCRDRSIPIFCFSIGGAGLPISKIKPPVRRQLLEQAEYVTLRLRTELPLLEQAGTAGAHHEDIVWTTPTLFPPLPPEDRSGRRPKIGVCLYRFNRLDWMLFKVFFHILARARRDCDFVFIESTSAEEGPKAYLALRPRNTLRLPNCTFHKFDSPEEGIEFLQSLDLVVTNRLHVGVTAMSYARPYVALLPRPKTVTYLRELGLGDFCWTRRWKLAHLLVPRLSRQLIRSFESFDRATVQRDAALHLRDLEQKLREVSAPDESAGAS